MATPRSIARAAELDAEKRRKEVEGERAQAVAVAESARVRKMFADDRQRLEKRYGMITLDTSSSEIERR